MYQSNPNMFIYSKIFNETISSINSNNEIGVGWSFLNAQNKKF